MRLPANLCSWRRRMLLLLLLPLRMLLLLLLMQLGWPQRWLVQGICIHDSQGHIAAVVCAARALPAHDAAVALPHGDGSAAEEQTQRDQQHNQHCAAAAVPLRALGACMRHHPSAVIPTTFVACTARPSDSHF